MVTAAQWLPAAAIVICAFSWVVVESIRQAVTEDVCICSHGRKQHAQRLSPAGWIRDAYCKTCSCRAFIERPHPVTW